MKFPKLPVIPDGVQFLLVWGIILGVLYGGVMYLTHRGAYKQLQKDAPIVAQARGDTLGANAGATISDEALKAATEASTKIDTARAKEYHYVTRITEAGPDGLPDDDWRSVITGMRSDSPQDSVPSGDQREPAEAPR